MEGDEQEPEQDVSIPDADWPYDPDWVELAASPLDQLLRQVAAQRPARYSVSPTNRPTIAS